MNDFAAGTSEIIITPPVGVDLLGYSPRKAEGVHDDLKATALVLDDGRQKVVICSFDLCYINKAATDMIRKRIHEEISISPENIMLTATHTHSGPYLKCENPLNEQWLKEFTDKAVQVIIEADKELKSAEIGFNTDIIKGIGGNRRDPQNGPVDRSVNIIKLVDATTDKLMAVILNHACHGTTLDVHNLLITADYPGFAREYIQEEFQEKPDVIFLNGACGDINPGGYSAEDSAKGVFIPNRNFKRAQQIGRDLGRKAVSLIKGTATFKPGNIRSMIKNVSMPLKEMKSLEQTERILAEKTKQYEAMQKSSSSDEEKYQSWREYFYALLNYEEAEEFKDIGSERILHTDIQAVAIDSAVLIGFPGELFTNIGSAVKENSPFENTFIVSYTNDSIGYFPTVNDLEEADGYEVNSCHFTKTAIQNMQNTAEDLILELYNFRSLK